MTFVRQAARRLAGMGLTLAAMSVFIFLLVELMPGDAAQRVLGQSATPQAVAALRHSMGLDDPLPIRYARWAAGVARGDLGTSIYMRGVQVSSVFWRKVGNSAVLALFALVLYVPLSVFFGALAGVREGKLSDSIISFAGLATMALPEFVSGILLMTLFSVRLGWLPVASVIPIGETVWQNLDILVLPALSITLVMFGYVSRMQRSSMISVMHSDYVRTATLKGLPRRKVIFGHALRNALLPTITIVGMNMGWLFGGLIVVETLFGFPGLGSLALSAVKTRDLPMIEACVLFITAVFVVSTAVTDLLYGLLNPRIRVAGGAR